MDKSENHQRLKFQALEWGFDLFGVADVTRLRADFALSPETAKKFNRAVSLGKRLSDAVVDDIPDHPTPLYFHHYRQINFFLDRGALLLAGLIQNMGYAALPIAASQIVDWENQKAHLSHKHVAAKAGLGWIGRNNLLVNADLGARFRLVTVLTDLPLEADKAVRDACGACRGCLAACPAGAIKETPAEFDHRACYEKLREFQRLRLASQFICGVCVKACRGRGPKDRA